MGYATQALKAAPPSRTSLRKGFVGDPLYSQCEMNWKGNGRNASRSTGQVSRIVFAAPGTIAAGAQVYLNFKLANCTEVILDLHNCGTTALPLAQLLADKINGTGAPGSFTINSSGLVGFSAVATAATFTVDITGPVGEPFTIESSDFGTTKKGIANPANPTVTTPTVSTCPGKIGYGLAVVTNLALHSTTYQTRGGSIADELDKIISTPKNHPTEEFVGFSLRSPVNEFPLETGSCKPKDCSEGYDCGECAHWMETFKHRNEILVQIEAIPAGTTVPPTLLGLPIFYRHTAGGGNTTLGKPSVLGNADATRTLAKNAVDGHEWRITGIADESRREYYIGVR
jgi:hypothetical protein